MLPWPTWAASDSLVRMLCWICCDLCLTYSVSVLACVTGALYYNVSKVYGQTSRDMRRLGTSLSQVQNSVFLTHLLDSVTRSPLYSIYGETIAGVTVIRAFGASSVFLREMLRCVDTNACPFVFCLSSPITTSDTFLDTMGCGVWTVGFQVSILETTYMVMIDLKSQCDSICSLPLLLRSLELVSTYCGEIPVYHIIFLSYVGRQGCGRFFCWVIATSY